MIDLDVCFFEISFSAFNRGIKNGCQQTASGPDPGSLLIKMDQRYIYIYNFLKIFSQSGCPCMLLKCAAVYRSKRWKKKGWRLVEDVIMEGKELKLFCLSDILIKLNCHKTFSWYLGLVKSTADILKLFYAWASELQFQPYWSFLD